MGVTTYIVPAIVVLMSWAFLGETPRPLACLGGMLCLAGVAVSRGRKRRPEPTVPERASPEPVTGQRPAGDPVSADSAAGDSRLLDRWRAEELRAGGQPGKRIDLGVVLAAP